MKRTINLSADAEAKLLEIGKKHHLDDIERVIEYVADAIVHGTIEWKGVGRIRVKPATKWKGMLPPACFQPGTMPDRGYWSKLLTRAAHIECIQAHFPGAIVHKKIMTSRGYSMKVGWKLESELNKTVMLLAKPTVDGKDEFNHHVIRGLNGKNATVGDLIVTLELLYKAHGLPVPTTYA